MAVRKKIGKKKLTAQKMFAILMGEMIVIRRELKEDILTLDRKLSDKVDGLTAHVNELGTRVGGIDIRMGKLESEVRSLRVEVHQNQLTFMKNHDDLAKRVAVLETR